MADLGAAFQSSNPVCLFFWLATASDLLLMHQEKSPTQKQALNLWPHVSEQERQRAPKAPLLGEPATPLTGRSSQLSPGITRFMLIRKPTPIKG